MTLAEWVAELDARLKDSGNGLFTVSEKEGHVEAAVQEYSRYRPRLFTAEITTAAGQQTYPLPDGCLWVVRAALPAPAEEDVAPGGTESTARRQRGWLEESGALWLFPPPETSGLPVRVTCAGAWAVESVPAVDAEAVLIAAHARCCEVLATETARAFVFWVGDEKFDKSEVSERYRELARELRAELRRWLSRR